MKLALSDGMIYIRNTKEEYPIIKGLPSAKYDKKLQAWAVPATADMLDRLQRFVKLPPALEQERQRLKRKQERIDTERLNDTPTPLVDYPVKVKLFQHQVRACNMAMYAFELEE